MRRWWLWLLLLPVVIIWVALRVARIPLNLGLWATSAAIEAANGMGWPELSLGRLWGGWL